ncbi:hypothetical protein O181_047085 [Austropuccinia psidii MF-1]|uniref:Uncharacterized protein n=1 Tax=Austropuccinia psidii MF-1 TaxID=1389203 RepID=A0A9Q3HMU6_9BASI|nr:hypothetical protein [Austropuccinia psidii MF-1]
MKWTPVATQRSRKPQNSESIQGKPTLITFTGKITTTNPVEGLITAKKWTPTSTQRNRKPQNSESIQGNPTLTTCTGKITVIHPVVTSKGKFPNAADNKFVQGTFKGKYPKNIKFLTA